MTLRGALLLSIIAAFVCLNCSDSRVSPDSETIIVGVAASAADALGHISARFEAHAPGRRVGVQVAASSTLARQVDAGMPLDVFITAHSRWLDALVARKTVYQRRVLATNGLVWVMPRPTPNGCPDWQRTGADPALLQALQEAPADFRLGLGDPSHVPLGLYGKRALGALGWWTALEPHVVATADARATLALVSAHEVDAAVLFASDARTLPSTFCTWEIPPDMTGRPTYEAALLTRRAEARRFFDYLASEETAAIWAASGFSPSESTRLVP